MLAAQRSIAAAGWVTLDGQPEDIEKGLALGASGYIIKASATPSEVVEKVEETLAKKS